MLKHTVKTIASGEYSCSCGAVWDRDEGDECPASKPSAELPGMWEPSDLSGGETDCKAPKPPQSHDANVFLPGCLGPVRREVVLLSDHEEYVAALRVELAGPAWCAENDATPAEFLAHTLLVKLSTLRGRPLTWREAIELSALATNMPDAERDALLAMGEE